MSAPKYRRIVAVDFDGTLAMTKFPKVLAPNNRIIKKCKKIKEQGDILILWTCRCGEDLAAAVEWCREQGLEFDYINENVPDNVNRWGNDTRKIFANEYIDDKATIPGKEWHTVIKAYLPVAAAVIITMLNVWIFWHKK